MTNAAGVTTVADVTKAPCNQNIWEERVRRMNALDGVLINRGQMAKHSILPLAQRVKRLGNTVGNRYSLQGCDQVLVEFGAAIDALEAYPQEGLNGRGKRAVDHVITKAYNLLELYD